MATKQESGDSLRDSSRSGLYVSFIRWMESLSETQFAYFLLSPAILLMLVIAVYPLIQTFGYSLYADQLTGASRLGEFVGLQNYVDLFTGARDFALPSAFLPEFTSEFPFVTGIYSSALTVTLLFAFISVLFETLIGFAQALILDQDFRGRRWVRVAIIIPWAVPVVIQGMIWYLMFQPNIGFLIGSQGDPAFLNYLGLSYTPLRNTADTLFLIIVADVWKTTAFMALLILAGLQSIDRSLYDVARVSGATNWQQFKMITFPLILPTVLVAMLFRTIGAMRVYGIIETMSSCTTVPSLSCLVVTTFNNSLYATSATVAFITAGLIGLVVMVYLVQFADSEGGI